LERLVGLFNILWPRLADQGEEGCIRAKEWGQGLPTEAAEEKEMHRHGALPGEPTGLVSE